MIQLAIQQGQEVDEETIQAALEATRPKHRDMPLPEWYIVAECMRAYHWTERQFWEDNSPAMIFRLLWLEGVHAEADEEERKRAQQSAPSAPRNAGMAGVRPRVTRPRR